MTAHYFSGCTLKTTATQFDRETRACANALGITLFEPDTHQCCGGVFGTSHDDVASKLSCVRALVAARDDGAPLITVCSACHNVIKQTNHAMRTDPVFAERVNRYLALKTPYRGETRVLHFLELLRDVVGFDEVARRVTHPLTGRRIAPYYGCLLLRPSAVMAMDDPENPHILEDLLTALGATAVVYPQRNECCGGYQALTSPDTVNARCQTIQGSAVSRQADTLVTACPLCRYNLEKHTNGTLPTVYITELVCQALGLEV